MKKEKLGQEQAFPILEQSGNPEIWNSYNGMSKRFYAACAAMQGMFANSSYNINADHALYVAKIAWIAADELLTQENE